jgi:hypothetical protein
MSSISSFKREHARTFNRDRAANLVAGDLQQELLLRAGAGRIRRLERVEKGRDRRELFDRRLLGLRKCVRELTTPR